MTFNIIGHHRQIEYFIKVIDKDRLAHAYCFKGVSGIGKFTFAKSLARYVMCKQASDYVKFDSGNHPDIHIIQSTGSILTEQVEHIKSFIHMKPLLSPIKVVIIDDGAKMVEQAQNKMLKVLEEPPGHALILIITENASQLLNTINSRTIHIAFNPLTEDNVKDLCVKHRVNFDNAQFQMTQGRFGQYLRWSEDKTYHDNIETLITLVIAILENKPECWLVKLKVLDHFKETPSFMFNIINLILADVILQIKGIDIAYLKLPQYTKGILKDNNCLEISALYDMIREIHSVEQALKRGQNFSLITEGLMFKIQEALHG